MGKAHEGSTLVLATQPGQAVTPTPIIETNFAFAQSCILLAAVELGLFTWIEQGSQKPAELAQAVGAAEAPLRRLLVALAAMGYLSHTAEGYQLTPLSAQYLVCSKPSYIGDLALQTRQEWDAWIHLTDCVRSGHSVREINAAPLGGPFFAPLDDALFPLIYPVMRRVCQRLAIGTPPQGIHILDLGAGAAPAAIAALELDPEARAVLIDFPEVLKRAEEATRRHGVDQRVECWAANLEQVTLPVAQFDVVFAIHVLRLLGEETTQQVVKACYRTLKPGGRLIVIETYNEQDHRLFPAVVSLNLLVNTRRGETFTTAAMREWLEQVGFTFEVWPDLGPDAILVATRDHLPV